MDLPTGKAVGPSESYAPASETDLSRAVAMRMEIYNMLKLCTLPELEIIRESLIEKPENENENCI